MTSIQPGETYRPFASISRRPFLPFAYLDKAPLRDRHIRRDPRVARSVEHLPMADDDVIRVACCAQHGRRLPSRNYGDKDDSRHKLHSDSNRFVQVVNNRRVTATSRPAARYAAPDASASSVHGAHGLLPLRPPYRPASERQGGSKISIRSASGRRLFQPNANRRSVLLSAPKQRHVPLVRSIGGRLISPLTVSLHPRSNGLSDRSARSIRAQSCFRASRTSISTRPQPPQHSTACRRRSHLD